MRSFSVRRSFMRLRALGCHGVFFLVRLTGDPAAFLVDQTATQAEIAHARRLLGLDRPLHVQYAEFLARSRGATSASIREAPGHADGARAFWPATVELAAAALLLSTLPAVPLGVVSATQRDGALDHLSRVGSLLLQSMPSFWLGLVLILIFAVVLGGLLPAYGSGSLRHLILPAITLAAAPLAQNVRLIRAGMLEVLGQDYVRTARAKGLAERLVIYRHGLWNAAIPVLTVTGLSLGFMLSGAIIIETVFSWPGLGRLIVQAVPGRDFPVIQAGVFVFARDLRRAEPACRRALRGGRPAHPAGVMPRARWRRPRGPRSAATARPPWARRHRGHRGLAVLAPAPSPADPIRNSLLDRLTPPMWLAGRSARHPLGTDTLGRDVASRLLHGARVSLVVGLAAVAVAGTLGVALGLLAGYYRGWLDDVLMRVGDVQLAFPVLLLGVAVLAVLGPGERNLILVLGVSGWITYARIVRGETLSLGEREFVEAARALGARDRYLLARHILPNVLPPITVVATFSVARVIIAEASLSFLGLGMPPPAPSWGAMLDEGRNYITTGWWLALFPGLAILLLVLGINLVGDWLRDLLDPRMERGM